MQGRLNQTIVFIKFRENTLWLINKNIEKLRIYVDILVKEGIEIDKAFLFGSYARDDKTKESDIDIMLVSKIFDQPDDQLIGLVWRLTRKVDSRLEPYTVGLNQFNTDNISPLLQIVKKEGVEI